MAVKITIQIIIMIMLDAITFISALKLVSTLLMPMIRRTFPEIKLNGTDKTPITTIVKITFPIL